VSEMFPIRQGVSYALDSVFAQVRGVYYPLGFDRTRAFLPPDNFAAMKGWLRAACMDPKSPVDKDPLDQYIYEVCGCVFDHLDGIVVNVAEYRTTQETIGEVRQMIFDDPYKFIRKNNPDDVGNYLTEAVLNGNLNSVVLLHKLSFNIAQKNFSAVLGCAEVETVGGFRYMRNPNVPNFKGLLRMCRQRISEHDCFRRIAEEPYELLVNTRDYRGSCVVKVPRIVKSSFRVEAGGSVCDALAVAQLVEDQKLILRRIYSGDCKPLRLFDCKGRAVGEVPEEVAAWLAPALDYSYCAVNTVRCGQIYLGEHRATVAFKVNANIVVTESEEFFGVLSYNLIKNFEYPDYKPNIVTDRQGIPLMPWIECIYKLYMEYQENPEKFALPKEFCEYWKKAYDDGAICEEPQSRIPNGQDIPVPEELLQNAANGVNAIEHFSAMLKDGTMVRFPSDKARILVLKAKACAENGMLKEAMEDYKKAEVILRKGVKIDPVYLAFAYIGMAKINIAYGERQFAVDEVGKAAAILEKERCRGRKSIMGTLMSCYITGGDQCVAMGKNELAIDAYSGAIDLINIYYGDEVGDGEEVAKLYGKRAEICFSEGYTIQAARDYYRAIEIYELRFINKNIVDRKAMINLYLQRAELYQSSGFPDLALYDKKRSAQLLKRLRQAALSSALEETKLAAEKQKQAIQNAFGSLSANENKTPKVERGNYTFEQPEPNVMPSRWTSMEDIIGSENERYSFEKVPPSDNTNQF